MIYSPRVVANAVLRKAYHENIPITHMKLQKLVYFMHVWNLVNYQAPLISERPTAWRYGPVFESLYHELKHNGSGNLSGFIDEPYSENGQTQSLIPAEENENFWHLLDEVFRVYGYKDAISLSSESHAPNGPWEKARQNSGGFYAAPIDDNEIINFYSANT